MKNLLGMLIVNFKQSSADTLLDHQFIFICKISGYGSSIYGTD